MVQYMTPRCTATKFYQNSFIFVIYLSCHDFYDSFRDANRTERMIFILTKGAHRLLVELA